MVYKYGICLLSVNQPGKINGGLDDFYKWDLRIVSI